MSGESFPSNMSDWGDPFDQLQEPQGVFAAGEEQARAVLQQLLQLSAEDKLTDDIIEERVAKLEEDHSHMSAMYHVTGSSLRLSYDEETESVVAEPVPLASEKMTWHGFSYVPKQQAIFHLLLEEAKEVSNVPYVEAQYAQHYYHVPIDGTALFDPIVATQYNTELLQFYHPQTMRRIQEAVTWAHEEVPTEEFLGQALRNIGSINFEEERAITDSGDIQHALAYTIDTLIEIDTSQLYTFLYDGNAILVGSDSSVEDIVPLTRNYALHGATSGVDMIRLGEDAPLTPCLTISVQNEHGTFQHALLPLNDNLWLYPCNRLRATEAAEPGV